MKVREADIVIVGAGPVGLMCSYLAQASGLSSIVIDKSDGPLQVGRADALNARTLQLLELGNLFDEIYPLGKPCNTSSVWKEGRFISRESSWWDELEGCFHKHFLMIGQSYLEKLLDRKLQDRCAPVLRKNHVEGIELAHDGCITRLGSGETLRSKFVIGADGSRSFVRETFNIPFVIERPQITWAVIDAEIETDFEKVPEIIVFQAETSDVAWIPREGAIDRFYVRMDTKHFTLDEALGRINIAMSPYTMKVRELAWFSQFSVKESVAENFVVHDRIFLAGDACHIHSVNGGQGLNTGLADAFNLIWKLNRVIKHHAPTSLLRTYEAERKPVALSVIESSGELVRSTKYSATGTHAEDYVRIVKKRSGNITGMGIRYEGEGLAGQRLHDFEIMRGIEKKRIYSLLDYSKSTLLVFGKSQIELRGEPRPETGSGVSLPDSVQVIEVSLHVSNNGYWTEKAPYRDEAVLVRPDSYIEAHGTLNEILSQLK